MDEVACAQPRCRLLGRHTALRWLVGVYVLWTATVREAAAQLNSNPAAFNPFSGQGSPPPLPEGPATPGIQVAYPVTTTFALTKLLAVDETAYTFSVRAYWVLSWEDPRTAEIIQEPYDTCKFYCSSQAGVFQNSVGQPACCDGVYIPQAESINAVGFDSQFVPYSYYVYMVSNTTVTYSTRLQGSFSTSFNYEAYPFDSHFLCLDLFTGFAPIISLPGLPVQAPLGSVFIIDDGVVIDSQLKNTSKSVFQTGARRPSNQNIDLAGWAVQRTWADVLNFTYFMTTDARILGNDKRIEQLSHENAAYTSAGLRIFIEVARVSRGFYIVVVILPIALIILFSFGVFSFSRESLKARINLLVTLFLTLIILQFVLQTILPGAYTLLSPFYLILVSYVYTFLLLVLTVVSNAIYTQYRRRGKHIRRRLAKQDFQNWRCAVIEDAKERSRHPRDPEAPSAGSPKQPPAEELPCKVQPASSEMRSKAETEDVIGDIDPDTRAWYASLRSRWFYHIPLLRRIAMWHKFVGQDDSQHYLEFCSHRLEFWSRFVLLVLYLVACVTIFAVASGRSASAAAVHVLPRE